MSLLQKASIITTPTAYAEDYLYSIKPAYALGSELVTNGNFANGTTDWSSPDYNSTLSIVDGQMKIVNTISLGRVRQAVTTVVGKTYLASATVTNIDSSNGIQLKLSNSSNLDGAFFSSTYNTTTSPVTYTHKFTATATTTYIGSSQGTGVGQSGLLDDVSLKEVTDADFDFTRASTGTRVNEDYLIEDVPYNLAPYSESFSTWALSNATATPNSETSPDGQNNATLIKDGTANDRHGIYYAFSAGQNTHSYNYSVYLKNKDRRYAVVTLNETTGSVYYGVVVDLETGAVTQENASNVTLQSYKVSAVGNGWYRVCITANLSYRYLTIATSNASTFTPITYGYNSYTGENKGIYAWGVQLVKGDQPKDYLKTTDRLDIPRIDYTNGEGSILLEPSRTNSFDYSQDFSDSYWDKVGATIGSNVTTSPEGITNASKIKESSGGTYHNINWDGNVTSGTTYTVSVFLKASERTTASLYENVQSGSLQLSSFNLITGEVDTEDTNHTANIENYGNGWFRCSITFTPDATRSGSIYIAPNNTLIYTGVTDSGVFIYGAQLEEGSYATSLIQTSGSAVTRSADAANNAGNSDLINSTEGVLYAEIKALADDLTFRSISINDGTDAEAVVIRFRTTSNRINGLIRDGGSAVNNINFDVADITEFHKVAYKFKSEDCALWIDGTEVATATTSFALPTLTELSFDKGNGSDDFYSNTKCVAVFKEALTDLELEKLTGYNNRELYLNYYNRLSYLGLLEEYNVESDINNYIL